MNRELKDKTLNEPARTDNRAPLVATSNDDPSSVEYISQHPWTPDQPPQDIEVEVRPVPIEDPDLLRLLSGERTARVRRRIRESHRVQGPPTPITTIDINRKISTLQTYSLSRNNPGSFGLIVFVNRPFNQVAFPLFANEVVQEMVRSKDYLQDVWYQVYTHFVVNNRTSDLVIRLRSRAQENEAFTLFQSYKMNHAFWDSWFLFECGSRSLEPTSDTDDVILPTPTVDCSCSMRPMMLQVPSHRQEFQAGYIDAIRWISTVYMFTGFVLDLLAMCQRNRFLVFLVLLTEAIVIPLYLRICDHHTRSFLWHQFCRAVQFFGTQTFRDFCVGYVINKWYWTIVYNLRAGLPIGLIPMLHWDHLCSACIMFATNRTALNYVCELAGYGGISMVPHVKCDTTETTDVETASLEEMSVKVAKLRFKKNKHSLVIAACLNNMYTVIVTFPSKKRGTCLVVALSSAELIIPHHALCCPESKELAPMVHLRVVPYVCTNRSKSFTHILDVTNSSVQVPGKDLRICAVDLPGVVTDMYQYLPSRTRQIGENFSGYALQCLPGRSPTSCKSDGVVRNTGHIGMKFVGTQYYVETPSLPGCCGSPFVSIAIDAATGEEVVWLESFQVTGSEVTGVGCSVSKEEYDDALLGMYTHMESLIETGNYNHLAPTGASLEHDQELKVVPGEFVDESERPDEPDPDLGQYLLENASWNSDFVSLGDIDGIHQLLHECYSQDDPLPHVVTVVGYLGSMGSARNALTTALGTPNPYEQDGSLGEDELYVHNVRTYGYEAVRRQRARRRREVGLDGDASSHDSDPVYNPDYDPEEGDLSSHSDQSSSSDSSSSSSSSSEGTETSSYYRALDAYYEQEAEELYGEDLYETGYDDDTQDLHRLLNEMYEENLYTHGPEVANRIHMILMRVGMLGDDWEPDPNPTQEDQLTQIQVQRIRDFNTYGPALLQLATGREDENELAQDFSDDYMSFMQSTAEQLGAEVGSMTDYSSYDHSATHDQIVRYGDVTYEVMPNSTSFVTYLREVQTTPTTDSPPPDEAADNPVDSGDASSDASTHNPFDELD